MTLAESEGPQWQQLIASAVAELDPQQFEITRHLSPAQRTQQALSMIRLAESAAAYRLRQRHPRLTESEALRLVRSNGNND